MNKEEIATLLGKLCQSTSSPGAQYHGDPYALNSQAKVDGFAAARAMTELGLMQADSNLGGEHRSIGCGSAFHQSAVLEPKDSLFQQTPASQELPPLKTKKSAN